MTRASPHLVVLLLISFALGLSLLLVPRAGEMGLIEFRAARIERAQRTFQARWDSGERSSEVVSTLCKIAVERGDVDRAIEIMQIYVRDHGRDVEALRLLAKWQRQAQRLDDWLVTMRDISRLAPNPELDRQLLDEFQSRDMVVEARETLLRIVQRADATPNDFEDLARIEAAQGNLPAAAQTLGRLRQRDPAASRPFLTVLEVDMRIDAGDVDGAIALARAAMPRISAYGDALALVEPFDRIGRKAIADEMLDARAAKPDAPAGILALWAERAIEAKRTQVVIDRLGVQASGELAPPLLRALLRAGRFDEALSIAGKTELSDDLVEDLVRAALDRNALPLVQALLTKRGEGFQVDRPLLAGEVAFAEGRLDAARTWLARAAEAGPSPDIDNEFALIDLALRLGDRALAMPRLAAIAERAALPDGLVIELATLFDEAKRMPVALALFERVRRTRNDADAARAWSIIATWAGEGDAVRAWLDAQPVQQLHVEALAAIAGRALDSNQKALALTASEKLLLLRPDDASRSTRAAALLVSGRAAEALPLLDALPASRERDQLLRDALLSVAPRDAAAATRLAGLLQADLQDPARRDTAIAGLIDLKRWDLVLTQLDQLALRTDLPPEVQHRVAYALLEAGEGMRAAPLLRRLATIEGGSWYDAFADAMTKAGRVGELDKFEAERVAANDTRDADRRGLVARLLERGNKRSAETGLRRVASSTTDPNDVEQLFFVWGPRPTTEQLAFAEQAARRASGDVQAAWLERLNDAGAARRSVAAVTAPPRDRALDAYVQALAQIRDRATLRTELARAIGDARDPARLHRLLDVARQANELNLARRAADRWVALAPTDPRGQRELGMIAFEQEDWTNSRAALERWHATGGDFESEEFYAEILQRQRDTDGARPWYRKSLARIEAMTKPDYRARVVQAHLLHRLQRDDEADRLYRDLLAQRPDDKDLRADYLQMLLELGQLDRARAVAGPR
ncbi:hypothetical protein [Roseiterribacter gracilis]|uniref:Tetratricopeptide repeat protein n=1 Tax=Roseiterribacter gracilis TaxID=2812848 RepID=A0A8S8XD01_9PROT|nr:hypothetical protein TMPK1_41050 [Rhodospirillales bacterium TMPK1]